METNFEHMNVKELRNELKSLNLKVGGNKSELIERLNNYHNHGIIGMFLLTLQNRF